MPGRLRRNPQEGRSVSEVARTFNVHPATIYRCIEMPVLRPRPKAFDSTPFRSQVRSPISEGALAALSRRAKPRFDDEAAAILARLRRARVVCSDETTVRVDGRTCWDWVFRNEQVVIHVVRPSRGRAVVAEVLGGHRPEIRVSD